MSNILITGATGYFGKATINFLLQKGVSSDTISAFVNELAEAAANVLVSSGDDGKTYDISNVERYCYEEVAEIIGEITGKPINYISPSVEEFVKTLADDGVPGGSTKAVAAFSLAHAQGEFGKTSHDLESLLGRKPTALKAYLQTVYNN